MKKDVYHYKQKTRILLFFHRNPSRKDLGNRVEKENASNMLHLFSCIRSQSFMDKTYDKAKDCKAHPTHTNTLERNILSKESF